MATREFRAMGCQMLAVLDASGPAAETALAAVPQQLEEWEQALSRFRADSDLSRLNRRSGAGATPVSPTLWCALSAAFGAAEATGGLVSPTLLDALEYAGYDRDFGLLGGAAPRPRGGAAPRPAGWRSVRRDARRRTVELPRGVRLDLGGVAKGWAADTAAQRLRAFGPALVDAGGDIAVSGPRADGEPWPIGVEDPRRPGERLDLLLLAAGGVATSGRDVRRWRQGDAERHHIIDPRTGAPAETDLLAVTVVAPSAVEAEAAAKAAFILGSRAGLEWLLARPQLAGLLAAEDGRVLRTPSLDAYRWETAGAHAHA